MCDEQFSLVQGRCEPITSATIPNCAVFSYNLCLQCQEGFMRHFNGSHCIPQAGDCLTFKAVAVDQNDCLECRSAALPVPDSQNYPIFDGYNSQTLFQKFRNSKKVECVNVVNLRTN